MQVDDWLRRISTNDTRVPAYEICMRTMDMLSELSTACEKQQTRVKLILDDMKQKENEYKSEGSHTDIKQCNLIWGISISLRTGRGRLSTCCISLFRSDHETSSA